MSARVRPAAAAGRFYPGDPAELVERVEALLAAAEPPDAEPPRAVVAPHAGYEYSGPFAAASFAALRPRAHEIRRVVVLGPAHFVPLSETAVPAADAWETPLGRLEIDRELRDAAVGAGARVDDAPHEPDHAVEVELPFLQRLLPTAPSVLPVAVGEVEAAQVADLVGALWEAADTVVVSTDLSHFLDDRAARTRDRRTAGAVLARDPERIGREDACGFFALRGLVEYARRVDLPVRLLALGTSADTAGDADRVVGYGAFAVG